MRRNSIFAFALYIAILWAPLYVEAQSAPVSQGYREEGNASWYGEEFSGRPTASGEIFNPSLFTAAHPTLPFGTFLFVTNKNNNRQVTVKVNDRGPFVASRIIDLSKAAAEHLDMINAGTVPVIIETLSSSYAQPPTTPVVSAPAPIQPPPPPPVPQYAPPAPIYQPAPPPPPYPMDPSAPEAANPYPPITVNVYPSGQPQAQVQPQVQPQVPPLPPAQLQPQVPPLPQYAPPPPPPAQFQPQYAPPPPPAQFQPQAQPQYAPPQALPPLDPLPAPAIKLIPAITPLPGSLYKIQVGSYKVPRHAVDAFDKLKAAGLNPSYEPNGEFYRVVLTRVPGIEVQSVADKLARAGFREALIREER